MGKIDVDLYVKLDKKINTVNENKTWYVYLFLFRISQIIPFKRFVHLAPDTGH